MDSVRGVLGGVRVSIFKKTFHNKSVPSLLERRPRRFPERNLHVCLAGVEASITYISCNIMRWMLTRLVNISQSARTTPFISLHTQYKSFLASPCKPKLTLEKRRTNPV